MPKNNNSETPPEVMTRAKSMPVIVVAGGFDALRLFFEMFWIFGPGLAALWCTANGGGMLDKWSLGLLGTKTAAVACSAGAAAIGTIGLEVTAPLGTILAAAVGLIGFLVLGLWIAITNMRLFKSATAPFSFISAFAIGEIPLIGAVPVFSIVLWRLYGAQIRTETAALKKWEADHAAQISQQREQQTASLMQRQQEQLAQQQEQEAANDEQYEQAEAADDEQYTQEMENAA
jgi:hypothetical protein